MKTLLTTIKSIFNSKVRNVNRSLQVSNCIDLINEQQVKLAKSFKKIKMANSELTYKRDELNAKLEAEKRPEIRAVLKKNVEVIESTIARLQENLETIGEKVKKIEDSRTVFLAKKALLDSITDIKNTTSNVFEQQEFNADDIMNEIDKSIREIEAEFEADDELNKLVK